MPRIIPDRVTFAFDPAIRCTGWAVFYDEDLVDHGMAFTKSTSPMEERIDQIVNALVPNCPYDPTDLAIEFPMVYGRPPKGTNSNDLIAVAAVAGAILRTFNWVTERTKIYCPPRQWKGTIKKEVMIERIKKLMTEEELESFSAKKYSETYAHNVLDAIGIGMHYLGRLR